MVRVCDDDEVIENKNRKKNKMGNGEGEWDRFEELAAALEPSPRHPGGGGSSKEDRKKGEEKPDPNEKAGKEKLILAKKAVVEKIQIILGKEANVDLHKSIKNYFEWVRFGLLALSEDSQADEVMQEKDLKVEPIRASGSGGQNVNARSKAVNLIHFPSQFFIKEGTRSSLPENTALARGRMRKKIELHLADWKTIIGEGDLNETLKNTFDEARVGKELKPREGVVLEKISERLEKGTNLQ